MTTKRKNILKAMAFASCTTIDDLVTSTGLARKNLHDNIASARKENLCQRINDDVTGQPAYRLTPNGRAWLENDKDDTASVAKPQPAVGKNSGSKDTGSIVDGGFVGADSLPVGNAVSAPPKPDKMPVAACADEQLSMAGKTITDFCEWLAGKANVRCPLNLREAKKVVTDLMQSADLRIDLQSTVMSQAMTIKDMQADIEGRDEIIADQSIRIALLESNAELPLQTHTEPPRYIIADNYMTASSEDQANAIALEIAKNIEVDTPVVVFAAHKARELRINWRDA